MPGKKMADTIQTPMETEPTPMETEPTLMETKEHAHDEAHDGPTMIEEDIIFQTIEFASSSADVIAHIEKILEKKVDNPKMIMAWCAAIYEWKMEDPVPIHEAGLGKYETN